MFRNPLNKINNWGNDIRTLNKIIINYENELIFWEEAQLEKKRRRCLSITQENDNIHMCLLLIESVKRRRQVLTLIMTT